MTSLTALRIVLAIVCLSHLVLGGLAFAASPTVIAGAAHAFYGATLSVSAELQQVARILGAYMLAVGVLAFGALLDPRRQRLVIWGLALLLLIRVATRVLFADEIHRTFGIAHERLWLQSGFFLVLALALLLLRPRGAGR